MKLILLSLLLISVSTLGADVKLGWNASPSSSKISYKLWQSVGTNSFTVLLTTTNTTATLTNLSPGAYSYYVTAIDISTNSWQLESVPSNTVILPDAIKPIAPMIWFMFLQTP